jgi:hypothetical protein
VCCWVISAAYCFNGVWHAMHSIEIVAVCGGCFAALIAD